MIKGGLLRDTENSDDIITFVSKFPVCAILKKCDSINRIVHRRGDYLIPEMVIFIVLNLAFFVILSLFIIKSATGAIVYEQVYAKQIALLIDSAKPDMDITFDMSNAIEIARENKFNNDKTKLSEDILKQIVKFDKSNNAIIVSLASGGGYSYKYFSADSIEFEAKGVYLMIKARRSA